MNNVAFEIQISFTKVTKKKMVSKMKNRLLSNPHSEES